MPKSRSGFRPKRSSNQTDSMSSTPTGILDSPNFERPAETIVDPRDERLLVLPFLEAGDHVGFAGEDRRSEARDVLRLELEIGRIEDQDTAAGGEITGAQRIGDPAPDAMALDVKEVITLLELVEHGRAVVLGSVVDDDDLEARWRAGERGGRLLHEQR
jgi:hypothetical protein